MAAEQMNIGKISDTEALALLFDELIRKCDSWCTFDSVRTHRMFRALHDAKENAIFLATLPKTVPPNRGCGMCGRRLRVGESCCGPVVYVKEQLPGPRREQPVVEAYVHDVAEICRPAVPHCSKCSDLLPDRHPFAMCAACRMRMGVPNGE